MKAKATCFAKKQTVPEYSDETRTWTAPTRCMHMIYETLTHTQANTKGSMHTRHFYPLLTTAYSPHIFSCIHHGRYSPTKTNAPVQNARTPGRQHPC